MIHNDYAIWHADWQAEAKHLKQEMQALIDQKTSAKCHYVLLQQVRKRTSHT